MFAPAQPLLFDKGVDPFFLPDLQCSFILGMDLHTDGIHRYGVFLLNLNPIFLDDWVQCHVVLIWTPPGLASDVLMF